MSNASLDRSFTAFWRRHTTNHPEHRTRALRQLAYNAWRSGRLYESKARGAAREDAERLDALEALVNEQPDRALLLHHGLHIIRSDERRYAGLGLSNTGRTLRQAIDQARGKENGNG